MKGRPSKLGAEAVDLCRQAGLVLDDWQELALVESLRMRGGKWASFEVATDVPRQNGKGGLLEGRQLTGLFLISEPLQVYSSHQFDTSLEAFWRLLEVIESNPWLESKVKRVARSHGEEGITLRNGCRLRFRTRTKGGGRGFSCDCLYLDEAMFLPEFAHGALLPTLSARKNPQVWYAGSAVDQLVHEHGVVFARLRERGHRGGDPSMSWYEWSVDADHPDEVTDDMATDPALWRQANPAIGIRIDESLVANEQRSMDARTFAVERLGVGDWPRTNHQDVSQFDMAEWARLAEPASVLVDPVYLAFEVSPDRKAAIAAAGRNAEGRWHVEIVENRPGTAWLPARLAELVAEHDPAAVVCDGYGPSTSKVTSLADLGVEVESYSAVDHARACARFSDLVGEHAVTHLGSSELTSALKSARTRPLGDGWAWSRKNSTANISPLVAATLALDAAAQGAGRSVYDDRGLVIL